MGQEDFLDEGLTDSRVSQQLSTVLCMPRLAPAVGEKSEPDKNSIKKLGIRKVPPNTVLYLRGEGKKNIKKCLYQFFSYMNCCAADGHVFLHTFHVFFFKVQNCCKKLLLNRTEEAFLFF